MKKLLIAVCCLLLVFIPMTTKAASKEKVKVYIFYGDGCPHCHRAFEFFKSIEDEYGKYYKLVKYETWYSSSNNKMMFQVAEKMGTDTENLGVPYIIIGDKTFEGYTESYDEDIKKAIKDAYENDDYKDKVKPIIDARNKENKETLYMACGSITALAILTIINAMSRKAFSK
jgi:glutaredoxin